MRFQGCEYREMKNLAILMVYHREITENLLREILRPKKNHHFSEYFQCQLYLESIFVSSSKWYKD